MTTKNTKIKGITLFELEKMFPDEQSAVKWFEAIQWPGGRVCNHCGCCNTSEVPNAKPMPYWCPDCRSYFSVKTGTMLQNSRVPMRKWVFAVYLYITHCKGVSSMQLHKSLGVTQKTAWYMLHRIRAAWDMNNIGEFSGPVEVDETYIGGKEKNKHSNKKLKIGRGGIGKMAVIGVIDRKTKMIKARVIQKTDRPTFYQFIRTTYMGAPLYTRMKQSPIAVCHTIINQYDTASVNMCGVKHTPTA